MHWRWINGDEGPGVWWYHEARHFEVLNQSEDRECEFVYAAPPEPLVPEMARDGQEPVVDGLIKFRKKPVVIEAVCWTGLNLHEVITFTDGPPQVRSHHAGMMWDNYSDLVRREGLKIYTLEGVMSASIGDWIIKGVNGEFYPCKPDIFAATYEKADAPVAQPVEVPEELLSIAERLVDRYIANKGTQSEFIACLTPERSTVGTGGVWDDWKALDAALKGWRADALNQTHVKQPASNSPVIPDDVRRMDWLVSKKVNVREPLVYGSHNIFWSQAITDDQDEHHATALREQIDAAIMAEESAAPKQESE